MAPRTRKLVGTVVLLAFLTIYLLLALAVAVALEVRASSGWAELAFHTIAGLAWVIPAAFIVKWMSGGHEESAAKARQSRN